MPIGSLLGGVLAKVSLRLPMYVGGAIATVIAIFSVNFLLNLGENSRAESGL